MTVSVYGAAPKNKKKISGIRIIVVGFPDALLDMHHKMSYTICYAMWRRTHI